MASKNEKTLKKVHAELERFEKILEVKADIKNIVKMKEQFSETRLFFENNFETVKGRAQSTEQRVEAFAKLIKHMKEEMEKRDTQLANVP